MAPSPSLRRGFSEAACANGSCFIAIVEGRCVGYGVLDGSFYGNGFVSMLFTDPPHRRSGVATLLMRHLESISPTPKLFTSTNESNLPMQSLLAKLGYERSGVIYNLDPGDPELVYVRLAG